LIEREYIMFKFVAKPKLTNRYDEKTFENNDAKVAAAEALQYLNEYNEMGKEFADQYGQYVPALKAEDWAMLGKLTPPTGLYFRDNTLMGL
jgi:hypothetical protein